MGRKCDLNAQELIRGKGPGVLYCTASLTRPFNVAKARTPARLCVEKRGATRKITVPQEEEKRNEQQAWTRCLGLALVAGAWTASKHASTGSSNDYDDTTTTATRTRTGSSSWSWAHYTQD